MQKVVAMRLDVKSNQICAEQPINQLALPGADAEGFRIGPRNMPENGHAHVWPLFLQHAWEQGKVIILNQNHRIRRIRDFLNRRCGKLAFDFLIKLPVSSAEEVTSMSDMS